MPVRAAARCGRCVSEVMFVSWQFSSFDCLLLQALHGRSGYTRCGPHAGGLQMLMALIVSSFRFLDQMCCGEGELQGGTAGERRGNGGGTAGARGAERAKGGVGGRRRPRLTGAERS